MNFSFWNFLPLKSICLYRISFRWGFICIKTSLAVFSYAFYKICIFSVKECIGLHFIGHKLYIPRYMVTYCRLSDYADPVSTSLRIAFSTFSLHFQSIFRTELVSKIDLQSITSCEMLNKLDEQFRKTCFFADVI